jgi:hypothetical protein
VVRLIELSRPRLSRSLGTASKLNRDPAFIGELLAHGQARAEAELRDGKVVALRLGG